MNLPEPPFPHLGERAPVIEALVDIRVDLKPGTSFADLERARARLGEGLPQMRRVIAGELRFVIGAPEPAHASESARGLMFLDERESRAVQYRLDGFTFSQLRPYESFSVLEREARRHWERYRDTVEVVRATRIGVRYINHLELPTDAVDQYLTTRPVLGVAAPVTGFEAALQVRHADEPLTGLVRVSMEPSMEPSSAGRSRVLLDLDVHRSLDDGGADDATWRELSKLRLFKNQLFFGSVTQACLDELRR